jgi:hypothetical protein
VQASLRLASLTGPGISGGLRAVDSGFKKFCPKLQSASDWTLHPTQAEQTSFLSMLMADCVGLAARNSDAGLMLRLPLSDSETARRGAALRLRLSRSLRLDLEGRQRSPNMDAEAKIKVTVNQQLGAFVQ